MLEMRRLRQMLDLLDMLDVRPPGLAILARDVLGQEDEACVARETAPSRR